MLWESGEVRQDFVVPAGKEARDAEFVAFVEASGPVLRRVAMLLAGDLHRGEELLQATLERTYRSWSRARDGDPLVYARRILANLRIDTWRRTRRELLLTADEMPERGNGDETHHVALRDELTRALLLLPVKQRRVVVLRHLLDLSEAEVAEELGLPRGTVKSAGSRGLATLREALQHPAESEGRTHER
ncbi:SigE family RNA polymerase sigma factor [Xylanimonas oleitrophica]|uniref:SigE family RNA polymerase sigma factor n=1 Tax=Xylanimonas oleitrophica TaxID=2607479 RepID=UPI001FEA0D75|nr:SigE family RNA polymerase sigma factor [Xylanimonas oleitrophica]